MVVQMIKTGEETGKLNFMLKTLGRFYKKEVDNAVDTLVSLIEPVMIVVLGGAVGVLLISILGDLQHYGWNIVSRYRVGSTNRLTIPVFKNAIHTLVLLAFL